MGRKETDRGKGGRGVLQNGAYILMYKLEPSSFWCFLVVICPVCTYVRHVGSQRIIYPGHGYLFFFFFLQHLAESAAVGGC